ncbi:MAG: DNA-binding protein [Rhodospirillaceae bacterium]|nr:MAG: DNA-binding protein [Rhodospirillaceae bacterium]
MVNYEELRTVKQMASEAVFLTESKLRWWIFHAETNGMSAALIKVGGRVYIDPDQFNKWLEGQRMSPAVSVDAA